MRKVSLGKLTPFVTDGCHGSPDLDLVLVDAQLLLGLPHGRLDRGLSRVRVPSRKADFPSVTPHAFGPERVQQTNLEISQVRKLRMRERS